MFKLLGIASALRVFADAIYIQQQWPELTVRQSELLDALIEKVKEIWTLIEEFETESE